jgi:bifunctional non-homologous end joining protein LigD
VRFHNCPGCQRHITANATEEIKQDGFRSLACIQAGECRLVSRNGNVFRGFKELAEWIGRRFNFDAFYRRGDLYFYAFDLLSLNGKDLRSLPLIERKAQLRKLIRPGRARLIYVDHVEQRGREFFRRINELDLEGIVAKRANSSYRATERPSRDWIKVKNSRYSQLEGREELLKRA